MIEDFWRRRHAKFPTNGVVSKLHMTLAKEHGRLSEARSQVGGHPNFSPGKPEKARTSSEHHWRSNSKNVRAARVPRFLCALFMNLCLYLITIMFLNVLSPQIGLNIGYLNPNTIAKYAKCGCPTPNR